MKPAHGLGWAALLLALLAPVPAAAQTTSDIPPPARYATDENGIDVARGEHLINVTDVSIGAEGRSGLSYTRQLRRNGGGNPYDMGLFQNGSVWTATVGLASYTFSRSGTTFHPDPARRHHRRLPLSASGLGGYDAGLLQRHDFMMIYFGHSGWGVWDCRRGCS
jgi:hypothetical protein